MRPVATSENPSVVAISDIVRVAVVGVQPKIVIVVFNVEDVKITIRVSFV